MKPKQVKAGIVAGVIHGAKTPEDEMEAMLKGYRAACVDQYLKIVSREKAEKCADEDTAKQRAKLMKRLAAARSSGKSSAS